MPRFVNIINNPGLIIEIIANSQPIMDSKNEKVRKQNEHAAKKKAKLPNFCTFMQAPTTGSATFLLSCPALVSHSKFLVSLLFCL